MAEAADGLSTSAPPGHRGASVNSANSSDFGPCIFSPGGYSYGATSSTNADKGAGSKKTTLKRAKGTGRTIGATRNAKSYDQLVELAKRTPGAEVRM